MAYLVDVDTGERIYLYSCHSIGRLKFTVDSVIDHPQLSKIHLILEWESTHWSARDVSTNGTWLDGEKMSPGVRYKLSRRTRIALAGTSGCEFQVADVSAPIDVLVPQSAGAAVESVHLESYQLLPDDEAPEVALYRVEENGAWQVDYLMGSAPETVSDKSRIRFGAADWVLRLALGAGPTEQLETPRLSVEDVSLLFEITQDEELAKLHFLIEGRKIDLGFRSHHYLSATLARHRADDARRGLGAALQGWMRVEQLAEQLGLGPEHVNIQIHRIRKQLAAQDGFAGLAHQFIDRRPGELRLAISTFEVFKGGALEHVVTGSVYAGAAE